MQGRSAALGPVACGHRRGCLVGLAAKASGDQREAKHHRPKHEHPHQLYDSADLVAERPIGSVAARTCGTA